MSWDVYKIENKKTGKVYIGSSVTGFIDRFNRHIRDLKANRHHSSHLQKSWVKHGNESFSVSLLGTVETGDKKKLLSMEQYYIYLYESFERQHGYNICEIAGSGIGRKMSQSARDKMSLAKTLRGKASEETKDKQSALKVKLSLEKVLDFMSAYWLDKESMCSIAKKQNLNRHHIANIVKGRYRYTKKILEDFLKTNKVNRS